MVRPRNRASAQRGIVRARVVISHKKNWADSQSISLKVRVGAIAGVTSSGSGSARKSNKNESCDSKCALQSRYCSKMFVKTLKCTT